MPDYHTTIEELFKKRNHMITYKVWSMCYSCRMLSPKLVKKLAEKKARIETGLFLVEGKKNIFEVLDSDFVIETIYGTVDFIESVEQKLHKQKPKHQPELVALTEDALVKMGTLKTNNAGIAVVFQKKECAQDIFQNAAKNKIVLALDDIRDPGNFGTIIRTADWFGVTHIVTSESTTDFYNPKTIAASMGSFTRVAILATALSVFLETAQKSGTPTIGAYLEGNQDTEIVIDKKGVLVMGSESHGINPALLPYIDHKIMIPRYGHAESLNVSVATGVLLARLQSR